MDSFVCIGILCAINTYRIYSVDEVCVFNK